MFQCPECGAQYEGAETCQTIFDSFLALEFTDPAYGKVHFLTVACFMIQHQRYSDEGLVWIQDQLAAHLEKGKSIEEIRRDAGRMAGQDVRDWKVIRNPAAPVLPKVKWSMTIADVAFRYTDAESYCSLVKLWAKATLDGMRREYRLPPS